MGASASTGGGNERRASGTCEAGGAGGGGSVPNYSGLPHPAICMHSPLISQLLQQEGGGARVPLQRLESRLARRRRLALEMELQNLPLRCQMGNHLLLLRSTAEV